MYFLGYYLLPIYGNTLPRNFIWNVLASSEMLAWAVE